MDGKFYPNIEYDTFGARALKIDLTTPDEGDGPYPVIVFMHGGGFFAGDPHPGCRRVTSFAMAMRWPVSTTA